MVDVLILKPNETVRIDTTANIVVVANIWASEIEIKNENGSVVATLTSDVEIYTLGYNLGVFLLTNKSGWDAKIYVFRSFIF